MVDVPVGQIALVQVMLGVVAVQVVPRRQEIRRGVPPLALPLEGGNVVLNGVHQFVNVVAGGGVLVEIVRHQLDGQIAGDAPHAHQAGVHRDVPLQMLVDELLRQTEAQRHVLMQVQAQPDVGGQIVVGQTDDAIQIFTAHRAKGVHDGELPGMNFVHLVQDPQDVLVGIAHDVDGVDGQLVAAGLHLPGKVHAFPDVVVVGGDADDLNAGAGVLAELGDVVVGAHRHAGVFRGAPLVFGGQQTVQLLDGAAHRHVGIVARHIAQKAHLHDVGARPGQRVDDVLRGGKAPVPVVDVAAVPQRAVQKVDVWHKNSFIVSVKSHIPALNPWRCPRSPSCRG